MKLIVKCGYFRKNGMPKKLERFDKKNRVEII